MSLQFRWLNKNEVAYGMSCIEQLWRHNHILSRDAALFEWQYGRGKTPDTLSFLVAEDDGMPVGCSGMILLPFHLCGRYIPGGVGAITIIEPKYRLKAHGIHLMNEADKGLQIVGSIGINPRVALLYKMQGRYAMDIFPRYSCVVNDEMLLKYFEYAQNSDTIDLSRFTSCSHLVRPQIPAGLKVSPFTVDDLVEWELTWQKDFAPKLLGIARNSEYLRWRYFEHPSFNYNLYIVRNSVGKIIGFTAFRHISLGNEISQLRILDFLVANEEAGNALSAYIAEIVPDTAAFIEHSSTGNQWSALRSIGMSPTGSEMFSVYTKPPDLHHCNIIASFFVKLPSHSAETLLTNPRFYMSLADGDQDRPN